MQADIINPAKIWVYLTTCRGNLQEKNCKISFRPIKTGALYKKSPASLYPLVKAMASTPAAPRAAPTLAARFFAEKYISHLTGPPGWFIIGCATRYCGSGVEQLTRNEQVVSSNLTSSSTRTTYPVLDLPGLDGGRWFLFSRWDVKGAYRQPPSPWEDTEVLAEKGGAAKAPPQPWGILPQDIAVIPVCPRLAGSRPKC